MTHEQHRDFSATPGVGRGDPVTGVLIEIDQSGLADADGGIARGA